MLAETCAQPPQTADDDVEPWWSWSRPIPLMKAREGSSEAAHLGERKEWDAGWHYDQPR